MSEEHTIESLLESNKTLQDEIAVLRNSNRILRTVHRALRAANESLRNQVELAKFNDDIFKRFCEGEFDAPGQFANGEIAAAITPAEQGGLPIFEGQAEATV